MVIEQFLAFRMPKRSPKDEDRNRKLITVFRNSQGHVKVRFTIQQQAARLRFKPEELGSVTCTV
jgi:hypothetical protein